MTSYKSFYVYFQTHPTHPYLIFPVTIWKICVLVGNGLHKNWFGDSSYCCRSSDTGVSSLGDENLVDWFRVFTLWLPYMVCTNWCCFENKPISINLFLSLLRVKYFPIPIFKAIGHFCCIHKLFYID